MSHVAQDGEDCESWDEACDAVNGTSQQSIPNDGEKNSPVKTSSNQRKSKTKPRKNNHQTKHCFKN